MSKIVPKLDLNKTPQAVENNSLVYARNIKLLHDGSIVADTKQDNVTPNVQGDIKGHVVGLDNKIYFFTKEDEGFYRSFVCEFDEVTEEVKYVNCTWSHSGGKITGCVTINNTGTKILTVCEYGENLHIPIKHIPIRLVDTIEEIDDNTDESLYTQSPRIPFLQLNYLGENSAKIRSGVYQFFVRYEISDKIYTNWFPCSKDLYTGDIEITPTIQGGVSHCDVKKDSFGFDFKIEVLDYDVAKIYENCQIGCVISTDGASVARIWKTYKLEDLYYEYEDTEGNIKRTGKTISFSYGSGELEEVDIDEMLASTFDLYNVGNIAVLKNRLYVANYNEDDVYDEHLVELAENIQISIKHKSIELQTGEETNIECVIIDNPVSEPASLWLYEGDADNNTLYPDADVTIYVDLSEDDNGTQVHDWNDFSKLKSWTSLNSRCSPEYFSTTDKYSSRLTLNTEYKPLKPLGKPFILAGAYVEAFNDKNEICYFIVSYISTNVIGLKKATSEVDANSRIHANMLYWDNTAYAISPIYKQYNNYDGAFTDLNDFLTGNSFTKTNNGLVFVYDGHVHILNRLRFFLLNKQEVIESTNNNPVILEKDDFGGINTYTNFNNDTEFKKLYKFGLSIIDKTPNIISKPELQNTLINTRTLLPTCKYDFYIHFVKEDGVTTPGYKVCTKTIDLEELEDNEENQSTDTVEPNRIFYPRVDNFTMPAGYKYAFLSVAKVNQNVLFVNKDDICDVWYSVDDNALLHIPKTDTAFLPNTTDAYIVGDYHDSYEINNLGSVGQYDTKNELLSETNYSYMWNNDHYIEDTTGSWNNDSNYDSEQLIRITPYFDANGINTEKEEDNEIVEVNNQVNNVALPGFICANMIPSYILSKTYYAIDTELYQIDGGKPVEITTPIENKYSKIIYHYSYYNTTLVSANGGLNKNRFKTWVQEIGGKTISSKSIINTINSQEISYFLQLDSTYKDFITPIFNKYNPKQEFNRFDTVVRRSTPYDNENLNFTYRFESGEYYPIPANRGKIVNLVAFADKILLHLEQALLSFDANNLLNTNEQNVALSEGDPFIQGVAFIEDGNYGKAGLVKKEHARLGNNYYIFFDQHENRMYLFDGHNKLQDISISILKLLECVKADDAVFAIDDFGGRFFVNLIKHNDNKQIDKQICLSYSIYGGGFISIHDFSYTTAFNTKNYSYIKKETNTASDPYIRFTNEKVYRDASDKRYEGAYYPTIFDHSEYLQIDDFDVFLEDEERPDSKNNAKPASVVDVICNNDYEVIKVLNSISWICNRYKAYDNTESETEAFDKINIAEEERGEFGNKDVELLSATKIRIYSDQTYTPLLTIGNECQDAYGVEEQRMGGYQDPSTSTNEVFPRYNNGVWTLNDFRDIKQFKTIQEGNIDNSLIHGKYIVVRFVFLNANFKLENVIFNMNNYEKV